MTNASAAWPRLAWRPSSAAAKSRPRTKPIAGTTHLVRPVVMEHLLDASIEESSDDEGQRQRRQIAAGLDRVDRLTRDAQGLGQLPLAEAQAFAQLAHLVGHAVKLACQGEGVKDLCHPGQADWPQPMNLDAG